ncbi:hypothetical protein [Haliscomenobacter sp.]|uniref:hypothetical protein n=1 Tax=Haliscomenobacter sp. TaxID=2717303 RepID=UPI003364DF3D
MATTEESLSELLDQLNTKSLEDTYFEWTAEPIDPLTTYSVSSGGTSHPSYGAVPNVTIGGTSATSISVGSPVWTTTTNNTGDYTFANQNIQPNTIQIKGEDADLLINEKSLKTWMEKVEERLNILTPNPELEKEWDELRRLGEQYRKLEKKCREKADMWKRLKSMPKPNIT